MVEFLLGLVGILLIILALDLVARIVYADLDSMLDARSDVATDLVSGLAGTAVYADDQSYSPGTAFSADLLAALRYQELERTLEDYPPAPGHANGFDVVAAGDPLSQIIGEHPPAQNLPVGSTLFSRILGKDHVQIDNAVWMPPMDDLME